MHVNKNFYGMAIMYTTLQALSGEEDIALLQTHPGSKVPSGDLEVHHV